MEPLVLTMRFRGRATPPAGEPPELDVRSETESVPVEGGEGVGIDAVSYETHVTFTSETTFTESGRVVVGRNGDALQISTVGEGYIGESGPIPRSCMAPWFGGLTRARERSRARAVS